MKRHPSLIADGQIIPYKHPQHHNGITLDALWLRDACHCAQCVDPETSQKRFETSDLPPNPAIREHSVRADGALEILWEPPAAGSPEHRSVYPPALLDRYPWYRVHENARSVWTAEHWDCARMQRERARLTIAYDDYLNGEGLAKAVTELHRVGLAFVTNVPHDRDAVVRLAEKIGPLRNTFYGATWDVQAKPAAENVAYTSDALDFHQDLLYMAEPPQLQLLHCLRPSRAGGLSQFSSAVRAFLALRAEDVDLAHAFAVRKVTYEYQNRGVWYRRTRPHVEGGVGSKFQLRGPALPGDLRPSRRATYAG